jgi:DNA-binding response OmpR family regulator/signal transduction histidine kinase
MKILVVEDDPIVAQALEALLVNYNYSVDLATDGLEGLDMAEAYSYDLLLLDIGLPALDGVSLCQQLRTQGTQTPALLLTGLEGEGHAKAVALNAGADDYVTKPFDAEELMARIQTLLRRGDLKAPPLLQWGALSMDPSRLQVSYEAALLRLTPKEYSLLEVLLRRAPNIVSSRTLLEQGWNALEIPGDEAVRTHIKELRKKLKAAGAPEDFVKTVHRQGYRLNPLYGEAAFIVGEESAATLKTAELKAVNEELRQTLEQLRSAQAELRQKNQALQAARDALEQRVADRTAMLSQRETELRLFMAASSDIVYRMSADWQQMRQLEGKDFLVSTAAPRANWIETYIPPAERFRVWTAIRDAIQNKRFFELEYQVIRQDGSIGWTFSRAMPLLNEQGNLVEWLGTAQDITERKQIELALQASEAKYRTLFNAIEEGFHIIELIDNEAGDVVDYRFLESNPAFARQTGLHDTAGKLGSEIAPDTEAYWLETYDRVARTGEPLRIENYNADTDRWYSAYALRFGDAGSRQVAIIFNNITERKQQAQRQNFLLKLSDALRYLTDANEIQQISTRMIGEHFGIAHANYAQLETDQGVDYYNVLQSYAAPGRHLMNGRYRLSDFPGVTETLQSGQTMVVADVAADCSLRLEDKASYAAADVATFMMVPLVKEGSLKAIFAVHGPQPRTWTDSQCQLLQEVAERTWAAVERARAEAQLRQSELQRVQDIQVLNAALEQRVQWRTAQLAATNQDLEAFASAVSHDLQTPLRHIISFVGQLQNNLATVTMDERGRRYLDIIDQAATQAHQMVNDLLEFSRMSQTPLRQTTVPMAQLVETVKSQLALDTSDRQIEWHLEPLPEVQGDADLLRLVWQNLLTNAIKYTAVRAPAHITIGSETHNREIVFFVKDNGVGFDMQYQDRLFDLFQRLHPPTAFAGNGVGLANVRRIIHRHGGQVWAAGAVDQGATFYFSLPLPEVTP